MLFGTKIVLEGERFLSMKKTSNSSNNELPALSEPSSSLFSIEKESEKVEFYILPGSPEMKAMLSNTGELRDGEQAKTQSTLPQRRTSGKFTIYAIPYPMTWQDTQSDSARWLDLIFDGADWDALFCDVLKVQMVSNKKDYVESPLSLADYPMLGRITDMYEDVTYKCEEVIFLRDECIKIQLASQNLLAQRGLQVLIKACDEALTLNMGLYLASD